MIAEFKGMHSPDVDLENYCPEDPQNFGLFVQVFYGPKENDGNESFDFTVCTADWLKSKYAGELVFLRHYILVPEYNYEQLETRFKKLANSVSGETWHDLAIKLARYGYWEFEDYSA